MRSFFSCAYDVCKICLLFSSMLFINASPFFTIIIHNRMYKKQHQLELRVEVEGVAEEEVEGEEDLCGGRVTLRSLLENNIIGLGVMILYTGDLMKRSLNTKHYTIYSQLDGRILTANNFVREHQRLKRQKKMWCGKMIDGCITI